MMWVSGERAWPSAMGSLPKAERPRAGRPRGLEGRGFSPRGPRLSTAGSAFQAVAGLEQKPADRAHHDGEAADDGHTHRDGAVTLADEAVAEARDGVEKRVVLRHRAERLGQAVHEIEGARQHRERHDDEG